MLKLRGAISLSLLAAVALAAGLTIGGTVRAPSHGRARTLARHSPTTEYLTEAQCLATKSVSLPCYDPSQIRTAYDEGPLLSQGIDGRGQTIAIVDSFGSPTIQKDLATFDAKFHLPAPPSLRIIEPAGQVPVYNSQTTTMVGWAGETTLDVEWAHAVAPGASILIVETPVSETEGTIGFPQIVTAEKYVIDHDLANVISQSFGANEQTFPSHTSIATLRSAIVAAAADGITLVAATGDTGVSDFTTPTGKHFSTTRTVTWPASDPLVTAVGGTQLSLNAAGQRTAPDQVWNDSYNRLANAYVFGTTKPHPDATGGGLSSVFSRPSFQLGVANVVGDHRGTPDISMSAACSGLVDTYQSYPGPTPPGWYYVCGTSEATPLFAGIVALADQEAHHGLGVINPALYAMKSAHDPGIVPVTKGDTTVSFYVGSTEHTVTGYDAGSGYNLASGLGSVNAALFVPELVRTVTAVGSTVTYGYIGGTGQH